MIEKMQSEIGDYPQFSSQDERVITA